MCFQGDSFKGNKIHMEVQTLEMYCKVSVDPIILYINNLTEKIPWVPALWVSVSSSHYYLVLANMAHPLEKAHLLVPFLLV